MQVLAELSMSQQQIVETIKSWDLSKAKIVYIKHFGKDEDVEKISEEYRRFMILTILNPMGISTPMSTVVDPFWHAHILCTEDYMAFSEATLGRYIHHRPTFNAEEVLALGNSYIEGTLAGLNILFGEVDSQYWGTDQQICLSPSEPVR